MSPKLRASVRAIILDEHDHVLLCRFVSPHPAVPDGAPAVWAAPGGGVEPGEDGLSALRRELREETGLVTAGDPPGRSRSAYEVPGREHQALKPPSTVRIVPVMKLASGPTRKATAAATSSATA
jgi:ADP-ribose pyrophosphatase YjhB (NUDIX family)